MADDQRPVMIEPRRSIGLGLRLSQCGFRVPGRLALPAFLPFLNVHGPALGAAPDPRLLERRAQRAFDVLLILRPLDQ